MNSTSGGSGRLQEIWEKRKQEGDEKERKTSGRKIQTLHFESCIKGALTAISLKLFPENS
jgi:hypothetical protein